LKTDLSDLNKQNLDVVQVNWDNPCYILALGCASKEYPCLKNIEKGRLVSAANENAQKRMALFKYFPSPFTARKAVFSYYQYEVLDVLGEFLDTKSKVIEFVPGTIRADVKSIFYHHDNAEMGAMVRVYKYFFNRAPNEPRTETIRYVYVDNQPLFEIVMRSGDIQLKVHNPELYKIYPHEIIRALNICVPPD